MKQICAEPLFLSLQKNDKRGSARRVLDKKLHKRNESKTEKKVEEDLKVN